MDPNNPREDQKAKFGAGHHICNGARGWPRLEAVPKKPKITCFVVVIEEQSIMTTT